MASTPSTATGTPIQAKSNIAKGPGPPSSPARKPATMRLGGVPISVVMPPRMVPKASGISTWPGGSFRRCASLMATGISRAMAPTLFMKADSSAPTPISAARLSTGPALSGRARRASTSTAPEVCSARLMMSMQATVITAGWPKPWKACAGSTSPVRTQASSALTATRSWRQRPHRNRPTTRPRIARTLI